MSEGHSIDISNLDNQQFTLNKINKFKHYFTAEIKERELMSKDLGSTLLPSIILISL